MGVLRLFVAVYPPRDVAERMAALASGLSLPAHRATPSEQLHLTLHFLGERDERQLSDIAESVRRSVAGMPPVTLEPTRLKSLPPRGQARLVALEFAPSPHLAEGHKRLVHRLAAEPSSRRESFLPHVTLLRFQNNGPRTPVNQALGNPAEVAFTAGEVVLVRSVLLPGGAEHRAVEQFPLSGKAG